MGDNGNTSGAANPADFEALARQYWGAWGEAMRSAAPSAPPPAQPWQEAMDWWTKMLPSDAGQQASDAASRLNQQGREWFGQMQQVAARFAGQDAGAADIVGAWKQALGAAGDNPFPGMFRAMRGPGQQGLDQWLELSAPYLEAWRREGASWAGMPAFGQHREHQERLQALGQAQADYQRHNEAYNALMMKSAQEAYALFERKLAEHSAPGKRLQSGRALFDLWIDAAEEAYAGTALSPAFRKVYGELVNAQMRLRAGVQREVEQVSSLFGMPTRTEVDGAYRKIAELERSVRRLRDQADAAARASRAAAAEVAGATPPATAGEAAKGPAAQGGPGGTSAGRKADKAGHKADKAGHKAGESTATSGKAGAGTPAGKPRGKTAPVAAKSTGASGRKRGH